MNILVAEDEEDIRRLIKVNLEQKGYSVYEAKDGIEALAVLEDKTIDMALLDVIMPRLDGFNLLREIRSSSQIPVIFLTARGEEMDKVLGFGLGADDYLVKPFSLVELTARMEAVLRRTKSLQVAEPVQTTLICGALCLDREACSVLKNNQEIGLNAKEYKMLEWLMLHPNTVFTKRKLYETVWEEDYCYDDNTIMVTMSRLRNKIEDDPKEPQYIVTVKGLGYKLHKGGEGDKKA